MPSYKQTVGNVEFISLTDGQGYGTVAVRSSGKLVIVDTGGGPADGTLIDEMQRKAVDPGAVDIVVITHLHSDHVGWNLTDGRPTFPRARYLVSKADWEYWTRPEILAESEHVRD